MTTTIKNGDYVTHDKHGIGIVMRLMANGLADVRFEKRLEIVDQGNLRLLDHKERERITRQISALLKNYNFPEADKIYQKFCKGWWSHSEYQETIKCAKEKQKEERRKMQMEKAQEEADRQLKAKREELIAKVKKMLNEGKYGEADRLWETRCVTWWDAARYQALKARSNFSNRLIEAYGTESLADLDAIYSKARDCVPLSSEEFINLKLPKLRKQYIGQ